jgi:hypothetical protein
MAAAEKVLGGEDEVVEYWPMAGLVFGRGQLGSAESLYAVDGPEVAIARGVKALMDPKGILPPWR